MLSELYSAIKSNRIVHFLIIGLLTVLTYFGLWNAYFTSDDYWMLGWVRELPLLQDAIWAQFGYGLRFFLDLSMWIRVQLFDLNAAPYYWVSIATHLIAAYIIYWLV